MALAGHSKLTIAFEGIDGCGKSTVAPILFDTLSAAYPAAAYRGKKTLGSPDAFVQRHEVGLRDLLWSPHVPERDPFSAQYWILLTAAWYVALDRTRLSSTEPEDSLIVLDGWYHRSVVKSVLRSDLTYNQLLPLFETVSTPTVTVLLDVVPEVCWSRTRRFSNAEIGLWSGHSDGDARVTFCAFQHRVREQLLEQASRNKWVVASPAESATPEDVSALIASLVETRLSRGIKGLS